MDLSILEGLANADESGLSNNPTRAFVDVELKRLNELLHAINKGLNIGGENMLCVERGEGTNARSVITAMQVNGVESSTVMTVEGIEYVTRHPTFDLEGAAFEILEQADDYGCDDSILMFVQYGHFYAFVDVSIPEYCDDDCDGYLSLLDVVRYDDEEKAKKRYWQEKTRFCATELNALLNNVIPLCESLGQDQPFAAELLAHVRASQAKLVTLSAQQCQS